MTEKEKVLQAVLQSYATTGVVATLATLGESAGIRYQNVSRALGQLVDDGRIVREDGGYVPKYPAEMLALGGDAGEEVDCVIFDKPHAERHGIEEEPAPACVVLYACLEQGVKYDHFAVEGRELVFYE